MPRIAVISVAIIMVAAVVCAVWIMHANSPSAPADKPRIADRQEPVLPVMRRNMAKRKALIRKRASDRKDAEDIDLEEILRLEEDDDWAEIGPIDPNSPAAPYLEAFKLMISPEDKRFVGQDEERLSEQLDKIWKIVEEGWNEEYPEILRVLEANREALAKLKAAIDRGDCYFPVPEDADFSNIPDARILRCRDMANLLALEARFLQKQGDIEGAAQNLIDGLRFTQDISRGGPIISDLVGISYQHMFLEIIKNEISKPESDLDFYATIEHGLCDLEYTKVPIEKGMEVEKLLFDNSCKNAPFLDEEEKKKWPSLSNASAESLQESMRLYEQDYEKVHSALEKGWVFAIRKAQELDNRFEDNVKKLPRPYSVIRLSYSGYLRNKARTTANYELARSGVSLELYATEKGGYPDSLSALVPRHLPRVPVDPFSGKPFKYVRSEAGWTLYSFGPDMDDDNAKKEAKRSSDDGDMILSKRGHGE